MDDRLRVRELQSQIEGDFWQAIRSAIAERSVGERQAVVYLHGYNTTFNEAANRVAMHAVRRELVEKLIETVGFLRPSNRA